MTCKVCSLASGSCHLLFLSLECPCPIYIYIYIFHSITFFSSNITVSVRLHLYSFTAISNYHNLAAQNNITFLLHTFVGQKLRVAWLLSLFWFHQAQLKVSASMDNYLQSLGIICFQHDSVQFSRSVVSNSLWPHGLQHSRPLCPSPTPRIYSNLCPLSQWCHPTISSRLQSFPASGSFQMSQFFTSGGQSIGVSASGSALPMNIQDCSPLWRRKWQPTPVF